MILRVPVPVTVPELLNFGAMDPVKIRTCSVLAFEIDIVPVLLRVYVQELPITSIFPETVRLLNSLASPFAA